MLVPGIDEPEIYFWNSASTLDASGVFLSLYTEFRTLNRVDAVLVVRATETGVGWTAEAVVVASDADDFRLRY